MTVSARVQGMTLTDFLLARLDEDEARVRRLSWRAAEDEDMRELLDHTRLDIAAKRSLVQQHAAISSLQVDPKTPGAQVAATHRTTLDDVLRQLATTYTLHPDWREDWRP